MERNRLRLIVHHETGKHTHVFIGWADVQGTCRLLLEVHRTVKDKTQPWFTRRDGRIVSKQIRGIFKDLGA